MIKKKIRCCSKCADTEQILEQQVLRARFFWFDLQCDQNEHEGKIGRDFIRGEKCWLQKEIDARYWERLWENSEMTWINALYRFSCNGFSLKSESCGISWIEAYRCFFPSPAKRMFSKERDPLNLSVISGSQSLQRKRLGFLELQWRRIRVFWKDFVVKTRTFDELRIIYETLAPEVIRLIGPWLSFYTFHTRL